MYKIAPELQELEELFAKDEIDMEELEEETAFWLKCEQCEFCQETQLCSIHYGQYVGR